MRKILLVEDDLSLIEGLKFSLSKHGFDVTVSRTVKEARACIDQNEYDLILLDLMLPDGRVLMSAKWSGKYRTFRSFS